MPTPATEGLNVPEYGLVIPAPLQMPPVLSTVNVIAVLFTHKGETADITGDAPPSGVTFTT